MRKSIVISEQDNIAALLENDRVVEFFVNRGELLLGDIYTASVENILPGIDAAFVNLGKDKMGFLHANDVPGQGPLKERLVPKQKLLVQITKEPTGHKGPRVSTAISLPGRFLVLVPEERGVSISRRISEARERARLKSVVNLMKPPGVGIIIRTEAKGQGDQELFEDFEQLWDRWQTIVSEAEASIGPTLIYRDQDLLFRVIRDAYSHEVTEIIADSPEGQRRAQEYLAGWAHKQTKVIFHTADESLLLSKGIDKEIEAALSNRAELPSGGHLVIQPTEALTVIDVNSGRFTSSRTQAETVRRTNLEAAQEIPRQLRLRNIGGMVIVDFIDMDSRKDQQQVLEAFQRALEDDRAKPQIGQLSDLGLVELTRRRQGQSLRELFTHTCTGCHGHGVTPVLELGPADDRRVIAFKSKEEESLSRRSKGRNRPQPLRSASVSSGRIVPSQIDDHDTHRGGSRHDEQELDHDGDMHDHGHHGHSDLDMDDVPEEILAMMPEDLLDARAQGKPAMKQVNFDDEDDTNGGAEVEVEMKTENFQPKSALFEDTVVEYEEEPTQDMASDLAQSVSAVESVYQELDLSLNPMPEAEDLTIDDAVDATEEPAVAEEQETSVQTSQPVEHEIESPYAAEVDPVTGIYRIKPKAQEEEKAPSNGDYGQMKFVDMYQSNNSGYSQGQEENVSQLTLPTLASGSDESESHEEDSNS